MKRSLSAATLCVLLAGCGDGSSEPKGTDAARADAAPSGGEDAAAGGVTADAASGGTPGDAQGGGMARDAAVGGDDATLTDATPAPNDGPVDDEQRVLPQVGSSLDLTGAAIREVDAAAGRKGEYCDRPKRQPHL